MHPDDLLAALRQRPFEPFRLHITDGAAYDLMHPDMVLVTRRSVSVGVPTDEPGLFERVDKVALVHITRISPLPLPPPNTAAAAG